VLHPLSGRALRQEYVARRPSWSIGRNRSQERRANPY